MNSDSSETSDGMNEEYERDDTDPEEHDSNDVILAFIAADEKDADERPVKTRSRLALGDLKLTFDSFEKFR